MTCIHVVFFSEQQYLFSVVPNEEEACAQRKGAAPSVFFSEPSAFLVWLLRELQIEELSTFQKGAGDVTVALASAITFTAFEIS